MQPEPDAEILSTLVKMPMPFGKYKDRILCDLPVSYLEWFKLKGFPKGKLGILLETICQIKINGLEYLLKPLEIKQAQKNPHYFTNEGVSVGVSN